MDYKQLFTLPEHTIYLNCAAQGPLSNVGAVAVQQAVKDKQFPAFLDLKYGEEKIGNLRKAISTLIDFPEKNIALANSTGWGINVLAQALPLKSDDEVLMSAGQFPSNSAPWEVLKSKGVVIRKIEMTDYVFDIPKFEKALTSKTKVVCLEWVHFVSGDCIPLKEIKEICSRKNILLIVDVTQGLGAIPFSMTECKPDAVVCSAYKWLLSPYGCGFFALSDKLISDLEPKTINWLCFDEGVWEGNFENYRKTLSQTAKRFDVFSFMGYLNIPAMTESIKLLNELKTIETFNYTRELIDLLNSSIDPKLYEPLNKGEASRQSLIASFKVKKSNAEKLVQDLFDKKIYVSFRQGYLRVSPFFYNTREDIEGLLKELHN